MDRRTWDKLDEYQAYHSNVVSKLKVSITLFSLYTWCFLYVGR